MSTYYPLFTVMVQHGTFL